MADSKDAGKKTMVDMVSVTSEGPTSVDKRNIIPFHSVSLNKTKNSVVRVEDSVSKVEIATDTVKIDNSIAEKGGLDQVGQIDSCFSKAQMPKESDQLAHQTIIKW
ncbi:hypothetical protein ACOSP7_018254 [Xanthoceras sorbifolium]